MSVSEINQIFFPMTLSVTRRGREYCGFYTTVSEQPTLCGLQFMWPLLY